MAPTAIIRDLNDSARPKVAGWLSLCSVGMFADREVTSTNILTPSRFVGRRPGTTPGPTLTICDRRSKLARETHPGGPASKPSAAPPWMPPWELEQPIDSPPDDGWRSLSRA
jgi:hypothetical protein